MKRIVFFLLLLIFIACSKNVNIKKVGNSFFENDVYIKITEDYKQVKDNLFEDKQGNLYIQGTNNMIFYYSRPIYISELYAMNSDKLKIKDIVDRDTYEKLADTGFSKDKQFLYLLKEWSDRWELHIISKDPNKYKLIWKNCRYYLYSDGKYYLNQDVFTEEELNMPQK